MRNVRIALGCGCLLLVPLTAGAQSGMSKAEAAQLYTAAGFPIVNDQPVNRCGKPAKPRVTFVDLNGDKRPEALFVDADTGCYAPSGRYFAVLAKEGTTWHAVVGGTGSVQALSSRAAGWPDMRVTDSGCVRDHHFDGTSYKAATGCSSEASVAASQAARPSPPPNIEPQPVQPIPPSSAATSGLTTLQPADEAAAFKTAGFKKRSTGWGSDCDDPGNPNNAASIENVGDLNGDALPEVVMRGRKLLLRQYGAGVLARQQAFQRQLEIDDQQPGHSRVSQDQRVRRMARCARRRSRFLFSGRALEWQSVCGPPRGIRRQGV